MSHPFPAIQKTNPENSGLTERTGAAPEAMWREDWYTKHCSSTMSGQDLLPCLTDASWRKMHFKITEQEELAME